MFKISEFSKLSQISVKALRYYDQLGLLKPAHTDASTGYRYYMAEQLFQLNRILAFKDLGFTLEQTRQMLADHPAQIRAMFRLKQAEIQMLLAREQARLIRLEERLQQIEREDEDRPAYEVVMKQVKPQLVVSLRAKSNFTSLPLLFAEIDRHLLHAGIAAPAVLPHMVLWYGCEGREGDFDVEIDTCDLEVTCPITEVVPANEHIVMRTLPEIPMMASVMHYCQPQSMCSANTALGAWIEQNDYAISLTEPRREVYLSQEKEQQPIIAEVQIPIEKTGTIARR